VKYCDWICVVEVVEFVGWDMSNEMSMGKMNSNTIDSFSDSIKKEKNSETTKITDKGKNTDTFNSNSNSDSNSSYSSNSKSDSDFEASVGMSRKWDAREAGREVAENTLKKLKHKPSFFLLFSTIHYEKHGGFQEFLNGVWDVLPEGTPLIGGTVAGFINPEGCYTRGVSAFAMSFRNVDVKIGVGHGTKKNPKKAAKECIDRICKGNFLEYKNKFIFQFISGATTPQFPGIGSSFVLRGKMQSYLAPKLIETSTKKMQKGIGREEEILNLFSKRFKDAFILSGSASDDMSVIKNYQFIDKEIYTNSIVSMYLATDKKINLNYNHGFHKYSNKKLNITKSSFNNRIIKEINNKNAISEFVNSVNWSEDIFNEIIDRETSFYNLPTVYFPLGFEYSDHTLAPAAIGAIMGNAVSFNYTIDSKKLFVLTATGQDIVKAMEDCLDHSSNFMFGISCCGNLVTLGHDIYKFQKIIKKEFDEFLVLFTLGEGVYKPKEKKSKFFNEENIFFSIS